MSANDGVGTGAVDVSGAGAGGIPMSAKLGCLGCAYSGGSPISFRDSGLSLLGILFLRLE